MAEIKLLNYFRSSTSYRVRIALALKGVSYDYVPVHLLNNGGEQNKPDYRALNPLGGVPTLVHGDFALSQSFAIIEYIDEIFPEIPQLFPKDTRSRAKVREFCQIINADMHSYGNLKTLQYLEKNWQVDAAQKNAFVANFFTQGLQACEAHLQKSSAQYCFGDTITAAECFLVPVLFTAQRFGVPLVNYPLCRSISERCLKLPAFMAAHPQNQTDTPLNPT
jgi:maleylacetoacetate isomerase